METNGVKLLRAFIACMFFSILSHGVLGQTNGVIRCYTDENDAILRANHPELESSAQFEEWLQSEIATNQVAGKIIGGVYQIPVVVHVIYNGEAVGAGTNVSYAAIQSQIDVLNEDFRRMFGSNGWNTNPVGADTQIEFCLAKRRPDGSAFPNGENGVNRINRSTAGFSTPPYSTTYIDATIKPYTYNSGTPTATRGWAPDKYMNIWLCNISGGILGYAQFPQSPLGGIGCATPAAATDGVVFLYNSIGKSSVTGFPGPYNLGRTATHEIGHWLGLRHIWGDGNCSATDYCNDTPTAAAANFNCPTGTNSCTAAPDQGPDMIENYMDYTDDACMNVFTNDQKQRMRAVLEGSPMRVSLINSDACTPPNTNDASVTDVFAPIGDNCAGAITPSVQLRNRGSGNLTSATISYTIDNGTPVTYSWTGTLTPGSSATVSLPSFTTPLGVHSFRSYSTLPNGVADPYTVYDTSGIDFVVSNGIMPNYTQDFEGETFPPDVKWRIDNVNGDCYKWSPASGVSSTGTFTNNIAQMPCFGNSSTTNEDLYTPVFLLPCNATAATLKFDVAYRKKTSTSNDQLIVQISTDCGTTWTNVYSKTGNATPYLYQNATVLATEYFPTASTDWRTETISLMSYVSTVSKNIRFRFRGVSANGNNIFIDNVKFEGTTPAEIQLASAGVEVLDEGYYNFANTQSGSSTTATFTITNTGTTNLILTNPITVTGTGFSLGTGFGTTTVTPGSTTTFTVVFSPNAGGNFTGNVQFGTNDCDEGTYNFVLNGMGLLTAPVAGFSAAQTTVCQGSSITFTNSSTSATSYSWSFPGGTPSTSTATNPTVTYATAGTYNVVLTATNSAGSNTSTMSNYVTVSATPSTPTVTAGGVTTFCTGGSVALTSSSGTSYLWSTGATTQAITANASGTYTVQVTNAAGCQSAASTATTVTVNPVPAAPTISAGGATTICSGSSVTLTSTSGASYLWSNGATTQSITATTAGTYTCKVVSAAGCQSANSNAISVTVNPTPATPTVTAGGATTFCSGGSVTLTSASGMSYLWSNGATTQSITATTSGSYTVHTTNASGCQSAASTAITVTVNPTPAISLGTVTNPSTCATNTGSISVGGTGSGTISWSGAASGTTAVSSLPATIPNLGAGSYTVILTSASGCVSNTLSANLTDPGAPAQPVITASSQVLCAGSSVTLTSSYSSGNSWSNGSTTSTIAVSTAGTYTVSVSSAGCTATSNPVTITAATPFTVNAGTDQVTCAGNAVTLTGTSSGTPTLSWSNGVQNGVAFVPSGTTTYTLTGTDGNGCQSTDQVTVTVHSNPVVSFGALNQVCTYTPAFVLTSGAPAGGTYSGAGVSAGSFYPSASGTGTFQVNYSYTDGNGCSGTAQSTIVVDDCLSVSVQDKDQMLVYPNPTSGMITLVSDVDYQSVELIDAAGRVIWNLKTVAFEHEKNIDLSAYSNGQYTLLVKTPGTVYNYRIVLNK